jgi:hypothetical protein
VRFWLVIAVSLIVVVSADGQSQERTLVDRLLKPDMTLQNTQQNQKFSQSAVTRTQAATTKAFYVREKKLAQNFVIDRRVATTSYLTSNFTTGQVHSVEWQPKSRTYGIRTAPSASKPAYGSKNIPTQQNASSRPFKGQGKSQKSLDAQSQHRPLTIDEVRELLNKNK